MLSAIASLRLLREAREQLSLIARRKRAITEAFYDIGVALTFLKAKDVIRALGRKSFAEVCEKDAGLSASTSERLVRIVAAMTREQALTMGQTKATAMALPGKRKVSPRTASALAIESAAAVVRRARATKKNGASKRGVGRTTTEEERSLAAMLEKQLHKLGLERARVTAVATKAGHGADLRFERIPAAKVDLLKKAIGR